MFFVLLAVLTLISFLAGYSLGGCTLKKEPVKESKSYLDYNKEYANFLNYDGEEQS